mgnify:CR=1 FL=1
MEEIIMMFRLCLGLMGRGLAVEVGKEMRIREKREKREKEIK